MGYYTYILIYNYSIPWNPMNSAHRWWSPMLVGCPCGPVPKPWRPSRTFSSWALAARDTRDLGTFLGQSLGQNFWCGKTMLNPVIKKRGLWLMSFFEAPMISSTRDTFIEFHEFNVVNPIDVNSGWDIGPWFMIFFLGVASLNSHLIWYINGIPPN